MKMFLVLSLLLFSVFVQAAGSGSKVPACMDRTERMTYNENQVLVWRDLGQDKLKGRAFVRGYIVSIIEDRQNHVHYEVDFDGNLATKDDRIEVIYNTKFGPVPPTRQGDKIIACGDFIKDRWSPLGAVIHWLHLNPKKSAPHEHGYLIINSFIAGQQE